MKKFLIILITFFSFSSLAYADVSFSLNLGSYSDEKSLFEDTSLYWNYDNTSHSLEQSYNELLSYYNTNLKSQYPYYVIFFSLQYDNERNIIGGYPEITYSSSSAYTISSVSHNNTISLTGTLTGSYGNGYLTSGTFHSSQYYHYFSITNGLLSNDSSLIYHYYSFYDTNINIYPYSSYNISGFWSDSSLILEDNKQLPKIKDLIQYNSWSDYENNHLEGYTTINLDNYDYVLLSLKDYSRTDPFQTIFQVKGQIGITPIYNFGQTSKDAVTGVKVQDRCNIGYSEYTSYPFYIIQSDLQNNAIYAVKSCESGSSFKFDSSIFDVTYITQENSDDPTITIDGKTYNVIPYDDLPSTSTQNEEDNYIPGESGSAVDTGGVDSAIKNVQQSLSSIWNTITYFTSLVGLLFSSLPNELRVVLYSSFVITITIGIIKFFIK